MDRRTWIPKPGGREKPPLGHPTVRDRVVQNALLCVIEPILGRDFAEQSYGFRPQRGCKDALRRVDQFLKAGCVLVVDAHRKSYFDTIPHKKLMERMQERSATAAGCSPRGDSRIATWSPTDSSDKKLYTTPTDGVQYARPG